LSNAHASGSNGRVYSRETGEGSSPVSATAILTLPVRQPEDRSRSKSPGWSRDIAAGEQLDRLQADEARLPGTRQDH
jgi:hypothetical protein